MIFGIFHILFNYISINKSRWCSAVDKIAIRFKILYQNNSNVGVGVGGGSGGGFGGVSVGVPIGGSQNTREIVIDFVDKANGEKLFWQAVSESSYQPNAKPEKREANFVALVEKVFAGYPPKK